MNSQPHNCDLLLGMFRPCLFSNSNLDAKSLMFGVVRFYDVYVLRIFILDNMKRGGFAKLKKFGDQAIAAEEGGAPNMHLAESLSTRMGESSSLPMMVLPPARP